MDISLLSKKTIAKLGSKVNDHNNNGNSIKLSDFALKQMKKMGWNEGEGLGRHSDGIKHHIIIKKRENSTGLGSDVVDINSNGPANDVDVDESWWNKTFSNNLKNMKIKNLNGKIKKIKKDKHDKKRKRSSCRTNGDDDVDNDDDDANDRMRLLDSDAMDNPSFEDLFKATGGKRLGMRARSEQKGKLLRTECMEGGNIIVASTGLEKLSTSTHVNVSVVVDHTIVIDTNNKEKKSEKAKKSENKIDDVDDIDAVDTIDGSYGQDQEGCNDDDKIKKPKKLKKSKRNNNN